MTRAKRFDAGKAAHRWWFVWRRALEGIARVGQMGADKYGAWNYVKGATAMQSLDCLQRHLLAWMDGEDLDPESGENHLHHAAWNMLRLAHELTGPQAEELDDRPHKVLERER